jgi:hypothetical protein
MAQSNLLENAQRIPVFYPYGKLANDQAPRFIRAPFVVLRMLGVEYVMPEAIGKQSSRTEHSRHGYRSARADDVSLRLRS